MLISFSVTSSRQGLTFKTGVKSDQSRFLPKDMYCDSDLGKKKK